MKNYVSGFLIVRPYEWLYQRFWKPTEPEQFIYAIPRKGADPNSNEKRYHGISRGALEAWHEELRGAPHIEVPEDFRAAAALRVLEDNGLADLDFVFNYTDAHDIFSKLDHPDSWELIWAANADSQVAEPPNTRLLGFEPTWFYGDHFSAIADSMCFPEWHGPDEDGTLFRDSFSRLNEYGLFPSPALAKDFLEFYRSFDWTETGDYVIAKVMAA
ncbi:MAG TPA: hypothetical protein VK206_26210 [Anaerolineales bacterium]|nr:hypothetical protein [Anaerolineales bacterium]